MDFLVSLDCPQYVCFEKEMAKKGDSLSDSGDISPDYSLVEEDASENMDVEDDANEDSQCAESDHSVTGSMQPSFTESYVTNNSYGENSWSAVVTSGLKPKDFPVNCPKNISLPSKDSKKYSKNKTTKTQPFHLTEGKKRKREDEHVPLAEQVAAFQKKTPERFHSAGLKNFQAPKHWSPGIVVPKSPNLQAAKRSRKVNAISREEQEEKEVEEIKRYKFRARPLNPRILQRPESGRKAARKVATRPQEPQLHTAQRAAENYGKHKEEQKPFEFHARPIPKAILNGPTGLKKKEKLAITEAKTPNFALKTRAQKWREEHKMNETIAAPTFKALPVPSVSQPFAVKHEMKRTEIQPFSFDKRNKERMEHKEQKIKEEIEKENAVYVFKAQPMPSPAPSALPDIPKKPVTQIKPFNLHVDLKNSRHNSFNSSVGELCTTFKAQPPTVLKKPPFVPEKLHKPTVEIKEFQLHTDVRASERLKLKEINDIKEHEKELALQRMKALQEEEEEKEIMRLRKEAVHKANPIRHYKPVEIKPSCKEPTIPISPKFKTDERLHLKH